MRHRRTRSPTRGPWMTDRGEDELLGRLRRANPIVAAPGAAHSVDHALAEIGSLGRRRWTWRRLRHVEAGGGDGAIDGLLRAANPYPASTLNADAPVPSGALFWSVVAGPTRRQRGRLRSPRGLAVVVVATASLLASAFGYVFAERNVTNATTVRCYKSASLGTNYVGITPGASGPVGSCRSEVWSEGGFGSPTTPPLVGCVLANGVEAVFPRRRLHLHDARTVHGARSDGDSDATRAAAEAARRRTRPRRPLYRADACTQHRARRSRANGLSVLGSADRTRHVGCPTLLPGLRPHERRGDRARPVPPPRPSRAGRLLRTLKPDPEAGP